MSMKQYMKSTKAGASTVEVRHPRPKTRTSMARTRKLTSSENLRPVTPYLVFAHEQVVIQIKGEAQDLPTEHTLQGLTQAVSGRP